MDGIDKIHEKKFALFHPDINTTNFQRAMKPDQLRLFSFQKDSNSPWAK